jgi:hypothetical protein
MKEQKKRDFLAEKEKRQVEIRDTIAQMEKMREDFSLEIQPFVRKWIQTIARQYVERNPEKALKLGLEKMTLLKNEVNQLCENVDPICREIFSNQEFWPETRELITQNQLGIRLILGRLGTILEQFDLVKTQAQTEKGHEAWSQYDCAGDRREFDGTPVYPHAIEIPEKLVAKLEEYRVMVRRKEELGKEIKGLDHEELQIQATQMWDSI